MLIDVRVRHEDEARPVPMMAWPADRLDELPPLVSQWGIYIDDTGSDVSDVSGQFRHDGTAVYFELIIHL